MFVPEALFVIMCNGPHELPDEPIVLPHSQCERSTRQVSQPNVRLARCTLSRLVYAAAIRSLTLPSRSSDPSTVSLVNDAGPIANRE
jgi:hypothetical protein